VAIVGPNAQGKSNLLEAIYYLETFRSFRGARTEQLTAFGEDSFRVWARVESSKKIEAPATEVAAAYHRASDRRKVTVDGTEPARIGDAVGNLGVVIFSPSDIAIVSGGPSQRRRFLDIVLSLNEPGYLSALQDFKRVLYQRNAALRADQSISVVQAWDEPLIRSGGLVMMARFLWAKKWRTTFREYYETVSEGLSASMDYEPNVAVQTCDEADIRDAYAKALDVGWSRDLRSRNTGSGPHRDELVLRLIEGSRSSEIREFGSGGQRRTAALALRLVEGDAIRQTRNMDPILLLDDAFAELDESRRDRVLQLMDSGRFGQVILTAPRENDINFREGALQCGVLGRDRYARER
jgi:DNA replication and repair protein RecF